ncbi:MAG: hypothetical protein K9N52_02345 [Verrucomicrobia bacterium]|nr:hypothetical protein [Verrucomicrobiota bacterium]
MNEPIERIAKSKHRERERIAALPFAEKIKILEQLRNREASILASHRTSMNADLADRVMLVREHQAAYGATHKREDRHAG